MPEGVLVLLLYCHPELVEGLTSAKVVKFLICANGVFKI
jgi:hypothetical protein